MTADWFRQTSWSDKHLAEFLARNERSRSSSSKAQHIRIQAVTLLETDKPVLVEAGLLLLIEHYVPKFSRELDASVAFCCAGQCCEVLGRTEDAVVHYGRALEREVEMPNATSAAAYLLAKLGVELGRQDLVERALAGVGIARASPFPWHSYIVSGARAFLAALDGDPAGARAYARAALESASVSSNGLGPGRDALGTVREQQTRFHHAIAKIAGA